MQAEQLGNTYIEMAKVFSKAKELEQAIEFQNKAVDKFSGLEKYAETDFLADIYLTLSDF